MPVGGSVEEGVAILLVLRGAMSERPRAPAACMKLWSGGVGLPSRVCVRPAASRPTCVVPRELREPASKTLGSHRVCPGHSKSNRH